VFVADDGARDPKRCPQPLSAAGGQRRQPGGDRLAAGQGDGLLARRRLDMIHLAFDEGDGVGHRRAHPGDPAVIARAAVLQRHAVGAGCVVAPAGFLETGQHA